MHTSRSIIVTMSVLTLLSMAGWLALQPSTEVKGPTPIASAAVPSKAQTPGTVSIPKAKTVTAKPAPTPASQEPSTSALAPRVQEPTRHAQPEARPARQDTTRNGPAIAEVLAAVEQTLKELSAQEGEAVSLGSATCEAASCQLTLAAADVEAMDSFLTALPFTLGWNATAHMEHVTNSDGSVSTTVFLERDDASPAEH